MKVFDFDNTLYRGESSIDLSLFMIKKRKKILLYLPNIFWHLLKYKLCLVEKNKLESTINRYVRSIIRDEQEIFDLVQAFWEKNQSRLYPDMLELLDENSVILSAGPRFLLEGIQSRLRTRHLVCTEIDLKKKEILYFNFGRNKVVRYHELYGDQTINRFYTDSYNDQAMIDLADEAYLVKNGEPKRIK